MNPSVTIIQLAAVVPLVALVYGAGMASAASVLGTAADYGVLAGSTVTNTGPTIVNGNIGVSPGSAVTGFPPGVVVGGVIHAADAEALQAQSDLTTAYNTLAGLAVDMNLAAELGGLILTPGVYHVATDALLTGVLTLDAEAQSDALFVFQIPGSLTTASASSISLINPGANDPTVFFQVGASATLGTTTNFNYGNIVALASITLNTGATLDCGSALARNGAVTLDTNTISVGCHEASITTTPGPGPGTPVPEPSTLLLMGAGLAAMSGRGLRGAWRACGRRRVLAQE